MMLRQSMEQLERNALTIAQIVQGVTDEEARWRPELGKWSIVEVVNHLVDEEREDFRQRLDLTLRHPGEPWPPIDPEGWAVLRAYQERTLGESIERFGNERRASIVWLKSLSDPDLDRAHKHPKFGEITAGTLLGSWVAHDLQHIRQLAHLRYLWFQQLAAPHNLNYAGPW